VPNIGTHSSTKLCGVTQQNLHRLNFKELQILSLYTYGSNVEIWAGLYPIQQSTLEKESYFTILSLKNACKDIVIISYKNQEIT
jgi:hypothetical protein